MANWQRGKHSPRGIKSFRAGATVRGRRIMTVGADNEAAVEAGAASVLIGVSLISTGAEPDVSVADAGQVFDVATAGPCEVVYGGAVALGDWLTSDGQGRAVKANPAAGANANIIGIALMGGVLGDIGSVDINPSRIQG